MELSWSSISAGAMAAAVSLGSAVSSTLPHAVQVGATGSAQFAQGLALVEKPVKAAAAGVASPGVVHRVAHFLGKALPVVTVGTSALAGAKIVHDQGADALYNTKQGRGAVLGAVGGGLLLMPVPPAQLAAAGVLGAVAANQFGAFGRLDARPLADGPPVASSQAAVAGPLSGRERLRPST